MCVHLIPMLQKGLDGPTNQPLRPWINTIVIMLYQAKPVWDVSRVESLQQDEVHYRGNAPDLLWISSINSWVLESDPWLLSPQFRWETLTPNLISGIFQTGIQIFPPRSKGYLLPIGSEGNIVNQAGRRGSRDQPFDIPAPAMVFEQF